MIMECAKMTRISRLGLIKTERVLFVLQAVVVVLMLTIECDSLLDSEYPITSRERQAFSEYVGFDQTTARTKNLLSRNRNQGEHELILHLISKTCNEVTMHSYVASAVSATKAKTRSGLDPDQQKSTHLAPIACHGVSRAVLFH